MGARTNIEKTNMISARPLDYLYDPEYAVASAKDFKKCMVESYKTQAEYDVRPLHATMFSDSHPRYVMELKRLDRVPPWFDKSWSGHQMAVKMNAMKTVDIDGADRFRFFRQPVAPYMPATIMTTTPLVVEKEAVRIQESIMKIKNRGTQTDYRESETQTTPWAPPAFTHCTTTPEILTLANFSWEHGLPAGMHEVEIIERARKRRAWESVIPVAEDEKSIEKMRFIIDTLERDEWLFREEEIQTIHEMRLELARQVLQECQLYEYDKLQDRLKRYWASKQEQKNKKIKKIRLDHNRDLRKLALKHKGINMKYHKIDVVEEHRDHKSELYGPQLRFGENPKRRHEVINVRSRFLTHFKGLEIIETMPTLFAPTHELHLPSTRKHYQLCIRETRWTEEVLEQLHHDLKDIRLKKFEEPKHMLLIPKLGKEVEEPETPGTEGVPDSEEAQYQAAILLQKIIRGRAIQTLMCLGRKKCQELIEEMKSNVALQQADLLILMQEREYVQSLQRTQVLKDREELRMTEIMNFLQGHSISFMLDFLSKELWRLQDERRAHAFAMLVERERCKREAAEAGRRQKEERRRREHDEMFKQVVKVHQDTVDMYLEDLILESSDWVSNAEARHEVRCLARKIDKAAEEFNLRQDALEQEELVADLIHNFVVPEVQKQIIRKQIKQRQAKYLQEAHASIYDRIDDLPPTDSIFEQIPKDMKTEQKDDKESKEAVVTPEQTEETYLVKGKVTHKEGHGKGIAILEPLYHSHVKEPSEDSLDYPSESIENIFADISNFLWEEEKLDIPSCSSGEETYETYEKVKSPSDDEEEESDSDERVEEEQPQTETVEIDEDKPKSKISFKVEESDSSHSKQKKHKIGFQDEVEDSSKPKPRLSFKDS